MEWSRNSGQMREPSAMRLAGSRKISEENESIACATKHHAVRLSAVKRMSASPACATR